MDSFVNKKTGNCKKIVQQNRRKRGGNDGENWGLIFIWEKKYNLGS
jgi:hypothetical protein